MIRAKIAIVAVLHPLLVLGEASCLDHKNPILQEKRICIDLSSQILFAFNKDGDVFMNTKISSGRFGHPTPSGNFVILEREKAHHSTLYPVRSDGKSGGASMPYMLRLTWDGIAIHEGVIPYALGKPYPDSHGCIRVPKGKAEKLFFWARKDVPVEIIGEPDYMSDRINRARILADENYSDYIHEEDASMSNSKVLQYKDEDFRYLDRL